MRRLWLRWVLWLNYVCPEHGDWTGMDMRGRRRRLVAFWTFTCYRCNRKESAPAEIIPHRHCNRIGYPVMPSGWKCFLENDYCPECTAIVKEALCPSSK